MTCYGLAINEGRDQLEDDNVSLYLPQVETLNCLVSEQRGCAGKGKLDLLFCFRIPF